MMLRSLFVLICRSDMRKGENEGRVGVRERAQRRAVEEQELCVWRHVCKWSSSGQLVQVARPGFVCKHAHAVAFLFKLGMDANF